MKTYKLNQRQLLPVSIDEAWSFFSSPKNLKILTPDYLGFEIVSDPQSGQMYSGMQISYKVKPVFGIPMKWVSKITDVEVPYRFADVQLEGPYQYWYHEHRFKEVEGATEMADEVTYALPLGFLGQMAHELLIKKQLQEIFSYREKVIKDLFPRKP